MGNIRPDALERSLMILLTGGAGFIGSAFVHAWLAARRGPLLVLDALNYAGNLHNLAGLAGPLHFVHGSVCDAPLVRALLAEHRPRAVIHMAAESHVDRSIAAPGAFVRTNVEGSFVMLEEATRHWQALPAAERDAFRFLQVSTDEVYGSLAHDAAPATEDAPCRPNNLYAATKAAADHLARAYHRTHGLPVLTTRCGNNYGPRQFPEKLIPVAIARARAGQPIPVYGDGLHRRDWIHVDDHCAALLGVLVAGRPGEVYNIGARTEMPNIALVAAVCAVLDELAPRPRGRYAELITPVPDRPGHDRRYSLDPRRLETELGWRPRHELRAGLRETVRWYLENDPWLAAIADGSYRNLTRLEASA